MNKFKAVYEDKRYDVVNLSANGVQIIFDAHSVPFMVHREDITIIGWSGLYCSDGDEIYEGDIIDTNYNLEVRAMPRLQIVVRDPKCPSNLKFEPETGAVLCKENRPNFKKVGNIFDDESLAKSIMEEI